MTTPHTACPLLALPVELRILIYEFYFGNRAAGFLVASYAPEVTAPTSQPSLAITQTCRQLRIETLQNLYGTRPLYFSLCITGQQKLEQWAQAQTDLVFASIRGIIFGDCDRIGGISLLSILQVDLDNTSQPVLLDMDWDSKGYEGRDEAIRKVTDIVLGLEKRDGKRTLTREAFGQLWKASVLGPLEE